jgi:hypothetical protein
MQLKHVVVFTCMLISRDAMVAAFIMVSQNLVVCALVDLFFVI